MVNLDPTEGREKKGIRPALVLSTSVFNGLGMVLVAPISARQIRYPILLAAVAHAQLAGSVPLPQALHQV